jgi:hypothetical protein
VTLPITAPAVLKLPPFIVTLPLTVLLPTKAQFCPVDTAMPPVKVPPKRPLQPLPEASGWEKDALAVVLPVNVSTQERRCFRQRCRKCRQEPAMPKQQPGPRRI